MADPELTSISPETRSFGDINEHQLFLTGIRNLLDTNGEGYPITANTTAHLIGQDDATSLETRAQANALLETLGTQGRLVRTDPLQLGGDHIPRYSVVHPQTS
jgi:hypothetical protein